MVYFFGEYELDLTQQALRGPDGDIALRPQAFSLLRLLIERSPELLARDEILDEVWGRHALSVNSLPQVIGEIRSALGESAATPRFIVTKHRRGYQFVGDVERQEPRAQDQASQPNIPQREGAAAAALTESKRRNWFGHGLVAALVSAAALWFALSFDRVGELGGQRPSLAILEFDNLPGTPDLDWVGIALADFVGTRLGNDESIRLIPGEAVARTRRQLSPARSDGLAEVTLAEVQRLLGADFLISGSFVANGRDRAGGITVSARLQNTSSGEVVASFSESAALDDLGELTRRISTDFGTALGFGVALQAPDNESVTLLSLDVPLQEAYFRGLSLLRERRTPEAIETLQVAVDSAPQNAIVRAALAEAYRDGGYQVQALQQARLASVAANDAPRRDRLAIAALAASLDYDWSAAERDYAALFSFFPDDENYGHQLFEAQINAGSKSAAADTLEALRSLSVDAQADPRWLAAAAIMAKADGRPGDQKRFAEAALNVAIDLESEQLQAAARFERANAEQTLGDLDAAREDILIARDLYAGAGAQREYADALISLSQIERAQGNLEAAKAAATAAIKAYSALEFVSGAATARTVLATTLISQGNYPSATEQLEGAIAAQRDTGDFRGLAAATSNLGIALERGGDLDAALSAYREAAAYYERANDLKGQAGVLVNLGSSLARAARWKESRRAVEQALPIFERLEDVRGQAFALSSLASISANLGDYQLVDQYNQRALAAYRQLGAKMQIARVLYNIALIRRRDGDIVQANEQLAEAAELFKEVGSQAFGTAVLSQLAEVAMQRGDLAQAEAYLIEGHELESDDPMHRARLLASEGRLAMMRRQTELAIERFEAARELRKDVGATGWVQMADLDLARASLSQGKAVIAEETARRLIQSFEQAADASGQASGLIVLGQALLRQNRIANVKQATSRARVLLQTYPDYRMELEVSLLEAGASDPDAALERLAWVSEQARDRGYVELALRAELAQAERLRAAGRQSEAKQLLTMIADTSEDRQLLAVGGAARDALLASTGD